MLYRSAPLPPALRRAPLEQAEQAYDPAVLGQALGGLLRTPPPIDLRHIATPRVALPERLAALRALLRRGTFSFDEAVRGADRMTVAVTLFALLELYKSGEADWQQGVSFGPITVRAERRPHGRRRPDGAQAPARGAAVPRAGPRPGRRAGRRAARRGGRGRRGPAGARGRRSTAAGSMLRELAGGWTLASHPDAEESARRLLARPRTPGLTPAQAETLSIVAYLQPVSRPEVARIRGVASESAATALVERGLIEEAGRSQFGAVLYRTTPLFLKLFGLQVGRRPARPRPVGPEPEEQAALRDRLLRAGEASDRDPVGLDGRGARRAGRRRRRCRGRA